MKTTFLYTLSDPETGKIQYLGKSDNPFKRYKKHLKDHKFSHKANWILGLRLKGLVPHMDLLDEVPDSQHEFWEREYIRIFRAIGVDLVNHCDGGRGTGSGEKNPFFGKKHTEKTRKIIREKRARQTSSEEERAARSTAMTGAGNHFYGKKHTKETIELVREASFAQDKSKCGRDMSGEKNPFFGKKHTVAAIEKVREAALLRGKKKRGEI